MRKERLTIEELQAMPKEAFPVTVTCDDGHFKKHMETLTFLNATIDKSGSLIALGGDGYWTSVSSDSIHRYPSLKPEPKIERFFEYIGSIYWYSEGKLKYFNGFSVFDTCGVSAALIKTGRYFDWDMDNNCIVGKVETLKEME